MGGFRSWRLGLAVLAGAVLLAPLAAAQEPVPFESDVAVALAPGFQNAFVTDIAVTGPQVRVTWIGQPLSGSFGWGYDTSANFGRSFDALPAPLGLGLGALNVRVAALPGGRFAYAWRGETGGLLVAIEEADGRFRVSTAVAGSSSDYVDIAADDTGLYAVWIEGSWGDSRVGIGVLDPSSLRFTRTAIVAYESTGLNTNVHLSLHDGVLALAWNRLLNNTSTVMFSHMGTDLSASPPVSVSGNASWNEGFPTVAVGSGGSVFVAIGWVLVPGPVPIRAWTASPPTYAFQPMPNFVSEIGATTVYDFAATFDALGRLQVAWVDSLSGNRTQDNVVRFTRTLSGTSGFLPPSRLDTDLVTKAGLAVASDRDGHAFVAWSSWPDSSDVLVHVARESFVLPLPDVGPFWVPFGVLALGVLAAVAVLVFLRRTRRLPANA